MIVRGQGDDDGTREGEREHHLHGARNDSAITRSTSYLAGEEPVEEGGAGATDVQIPRGRRGETHANIRLQGEVWLRYMEWIE
jgi:hypothetical protein